MMASTKTESVILIGSRGFWSMRARVQGILPEYARLHYSENLEIAGENWRTVRAVVASDQVVDAFLMDKYPNLRVIARTGTGCDAVDIEAARKRGVAVTRVAKLNAEATSEFALGLIFALTKHVMPLHVAMTQEKWARIHGMLLGDMAVGIIGLGHVGRALAKKLHNLDVQKVLGWNRTLRPEVRELVEVAKCVELADFDEVFARSDVVVVALALTPETKGIVDESALARMKQTAFLVNVCRGAVVDENALAQYVASRKIGGAALDVFSVEPPADWTIFEKPFMRSLVASARQGCNVILTPHTASLTNDVVERVAMQVARNITGVLTNNLENVEVVQ